MRNGPLHALLMMTIGIGFSLLACSCAQPVRLPNVTGTPLSVEVYDGGRPVRSVSLAPHSAAAAVFESTLQKPADAWTANVVDYAPGILVRGESFTMNFHPHLIILDAADDRGRPSQWVCDLAESAYADVSRAVDELPTGR